MWGEKEDFLFDLDKILVSFVGIKGREEVFSKYDDSEGTFEIKGGLSNGVSVIICWGWFFDLFLLPVDKNEENFEFGDSVLGDKEAIFYVVLIKVGLEFWFFVWRSWCYDGIFYVR